LRQQPEEQWLKSAENEDLIVTSQGQPVAVLLPINAESLEPTLSTLRSVRALLAFKALQNAAEVNGTSGLSLEEIDAEIDAARQARYAGDHARRFHCSMENAPSRKLTRTKFKLEPLSLI
jgi:antitoxin (DNA-binding transcriptional repressor) of toxin-antitoxin stability system